MRLVDKKISLDEKMKSIIYVATLIKSHIEHCEYENDRPQDHRVHNFLSF